MHGFRGLGWAEVAVLGVVLLLVLNRRSRPGPGRAWEHAERMKAMEMGLPAPPSGSAWPRALVCIAIGAFVPIGVFFFALLVSLRGAGGTATQATAWGVSFLVSTVAIGCGTGLAFTLLGSADRPEQRQAAGKPPAFDPESFEVADHHR